MKIEEIEEKATNVFEALKIHYVKNTCCEDCPYFKTDYCVDKLFNDILVLARLLYLETQIAEIERFKEKIRWDID